MMKKGLLTLAIAVALGVTAAYPLALAGGGRSSCPGKIICPITGEAVCRDQCPLDGSATKVVARASCCAKTK